ncbi:MAG TPA: hypothetical protein VG963_26930 [Polyangiaceae bacterium]|nr:hypothetical protein [Polyangiaceae bacterium]
MQRSVWRSVGILFCALPALAGLLGETGCGSSGGSQDAELSTQDASYCEPGTLSCFCDSDGNCDVGLVCDVGRCLGSEGNPETLDPPTTIQGAAIPGTVDALDAGTSAKPSPPDAATTANPSDAGANAASDAGADASSGA